MNGISPQVAPGTYALARIIRTYNSGLEKSLERISSGLRVNRPSDDIAAYFKAQELNKLAAYSAEASRSLEDHLSRLKTAEDALKSIEKLMESMLDFAKKASSEDNDQVRAAYGREYDEIRRQIVSIVQSTRYKGEQILSGIYDTAAVVNTRPGNAIAARVGEQVSDQMTYEILDTRFALDSESNASNTYRGLNLSSTSSAEILWGDSGSGKTNAQAFADALEKQDSGLVRLRRNMSRISTNITAISAARSSLDNRQNNYLAAASAYAGVDQAEETSRYTAMQIQQQAAASLLAQSNLSYGSVIGLLTGFHKR